MVEKDEAVLIELAERYPELLVGLEQMIAENPESSAAAAATATATAPARPTPVAAAAAAPVAPPPYPPSRAPPPPHGYGGYGAPPPPHAPAVSAGGFYDDSAQAAASVAPAGAASSFYDSGRSDGYGPPAPARPPARQSALLELQRYVGAADVDGIQRVIDVRTCR